MGFNRTCTRIRNDILVFMQLILRKLMGDGTLPILVTYLTSFLKWSGSFVALYFVPSRLLLKVEKEQQATALITIITYLRL